MGEGGVKCGHVKCNAPIDRGSHDGLVVPIRHVYEDSEFVEDTTTRLHFQRLVEAS